MIDELVRRLISRLKWLMMSDHIADYVADQALETEWQLQENIDK